MLKSVPGFISHLGGPRRFHIRHIVWLFSNEYRLASRPPSSFLWHRGKKFQRWAFQVTSLWKVVVLLPMGGALNLVREWMVARKNNDIINDEHFKVHSIVFSWPLIYVNIWIWTFNFTKVLKLDQYNFKRLPLDFICSGPTKKKPGMLCEHVCQWRILTLTMWRV